MQDRRVHCAANLEHRLVSWFRLALGCSTLLVWSAPTFAQTVAVFQPPNHSARTNETVERLRGELLSLGFEVQLSDRPAEAESAAPDASDWQQALAAEGQVDAALDVVGDALPPAVDVWIFDGAHGFRLIAHVALEKDTESAKKRLAIQAIEVLRAHLFETHLAFGRRSRVIAPRPAISISPPTTGPKEHLRTLGIELGAATIASLDGVGPAILPLARLDWALGSAVIVQATAAGFGTRPTIATAEGNARVATQYGLLGGSYRLSPERRVSPFLTLSAGVIRTAAEGRAEVPRRGQSVTQWSFLLDASLGASFEIMPHHSVSLAAHAQFAEPYVAIYFADRRVASSGRPNLALSLTVGFWP